MTKILRKIAILPYPVALVFALPRAISLPLRLPALSRGRAMTLLAALGAVAVVTYVFMVNAILLAGQNLSEDQRALNRLTHEVAVLQSKTARYQSPAWVQAASRSFGLVDVDDIQYIAAEHSFALSQ